MRAGAASNSPPRRWAWPFNRPRRAREPAMPHGRIIIIHIGTHKTATSSIQVFLQQQRERLRAGGLYLPRAGVSPNSHGHHNIAWSLRPHEPRFDPAHGGLDDLLQDLAACGCDRAVISSEDFEYVVQYPATLRAFDARLTEAGWTPHYLVFFRNPESYQDSLYAELLKHGLDMPWDTFKAQAVRHGHLRTHGDWYFNFDRAAFLAEWRAALGRDIQAASYDEAVAGPGVLPTFLSLIGAPEDTIRESQSAPMLNRRC